MCERAGIGKRRGRYHSKSRKLIFRPSLIVKSVEEPAYSSKKYMKSFGRGEQQKII